MKARKFQLLFMIAVAVAIIGAFAFWRSDMREASPARESGHGPSHPKASKPALADGIEASAPSAAQPAAVDPARLRSLPLSQLEDSEAQVAYEQYEKDLPREFNPFENEVGRVLGTVAISSGGYEIQFKLLMKSSETETDGAKFFPVLFDRLESSSSGVSTAASMTKLMSTEHGQIILHLYTPMVMDMLQEESDQERNVQMRKVLGELSDIMVSIDSKKKETTVMARRHLDPGETPIEIGRFQYKISRP